MVFNHSIKVPTQYKKAAIIFRKAITEKKPLKTLIYEEKHAKIPNLVALFNKYSDNKDIIESIIEDTKILIDNPRIDSFMCRVLITELIFGTRELKGKSKPVQCVLSYKLKFLDYINEHKLPEITKAPKPRFIRINTNIITLEEALKFLEDDGWKRKNKTFETYEEYLKIIAELEEDEFMLDMHVRNLLVFSSKTKNYWAQSEWVSEKKFMLQDKATCVVSELLNPSPESIVLDMCAAPGMKTTHLSNIMENKGKIYSVERDDNRYTLLLDMVSKANAEIVVPIKKDVLKITEKDVPGVEYILVDPSCSGSGMQSRISLMKDDLVNNPKRLKKLAGLQIKILLHAMTAFPKAKRIVYSTCSIHEEENEQVVQRCLERCSNFKLLNGKKFLKRQWINVGNTKYEGVGKHCIYALTEKDLTHGIFIAAFERISSEK